jgi:hypothetical protein
MSDVRRLCGREKALDDMINGPRIGPKPASSIPTKTTILATPLEDVPNGTTIPAKNYKPPMPKNIV